MSVELLAPAGNAACALAAINNGADAIYLGYSVFSARAQADNFDLEALKELIGQAHFLGVKVYVAMNTLVKDAELEEFLRTLLNVWRVGADAIILQDIFLGKYVHEHYPKIVLHLSTQAGVCEEYGARLAKEYGFSRIILARETGLEEIKKITRIIETEAFVQGALCTCFSGQCYFSSFAGGNSGNRGRCKQPCRKLYAYDRTGFEDRAYALSLSDLSVGEDIQKLIDAGVTSFKIEGRMRREEYVASAVAYYRSLLDGTGGASERLSDLRRTYNRGNYTRGLAFGQDKKFLSRNVQGHIGEKVGVIKVIDGKYLVESTFAPAKGDGFKILRAGKEVGGASFEAYRKRGFSVFSKARLKNGDGVFVTTDTETAKRVLSVEKRRKIELFLSFGVNSPATAVCRYDEGEIRAETAYALPEAVGTPLRKEELTDCFSKTDRLPVEVSFGEVELVGAPFMAKSQLNAFRREVYAQLYEALTVNKNTVYELQAVEKPSFVGRTEKTVLVGGDPENEGDFAVVYKPDDYRADMKPFRGEGYIYYPAFADEPTKKRIAELIALSGAAGIYAENYGGLLFAREHGVKAIAGTGFNLTNALSLNEALNAPETAYCTLSKELSESEQAALVGERTLALSSGDLKLMDLCYCPFGQTCASCEKKRTYTLTDENNRAFPVRRYQDGGGRCRFEVYNCASLIGNVVLGAGKIIDASTSKNGELALSVKDDVDRQKNVYRSYTFGHAKKSVL